MPTIKTSALQAQKTQLFIGDKPIKNLYVRQPDGSWLPEYRYAWEAGPWGQCSLPCGGGIQYRSIKCKRSDNVYRDDRFCGDIIRPAPSQTCNTNACSIRVITDIDDWGTIGPCDPAGNYQGTVVNIPGRCIDKNYYGYTWDIHVGTKYSGYYYFRVKVDGVGGGSCEGFRLQLENGPSCELVTNIQSSFGYLPGGFCCRAWCHHGPWMRTYRTTAEGVFRLLV